LSKQQKDKRCECGRPKADAIASHRYHSGEHVYTFHRCECGREWTEDKIDVDERDPVTAEEVLNVHEFFKRFDKPLSELLSEQE
jgi:hypothetical protein